MTDNLFNPLCNLHGIFPEPVKIVELPRDFTEEELNFLLGLEQGPNTGNKISTNGKVLEDPSVKGLLDFCTQETNIYLNEVYRPSNHIESYITQSWVNFTEPGSYHHEHTHSNSFISGVLYLDADKEFDKIHFSNKKDHEWIKIDTEDFHVFNSKTWFFPVWTKALILFSSSLLHYVTPTENPKTRVSLSFNSFLKGDLGIPIHRTHLHLPGPHPG